MEMENLHVKVLSWHSVNKVFTVVNVGMFFCFQQATFCDWKTNYVHSECVNNDL